ncbi:MAG: sigma-54-dependent Fis family transcriptional regulator [bacterium]|nr:sigma-54-dependent Fis family transcriptional regulator [bacterium]
MNTEALKLLVVDDEAAMREVLELRLSRAGFEVQVAENGVEARDLTEQFEPDIVLSDVVLPDTTGVHLLSHLREGDPDRPVILMTGYGTVDTAVEAMKHGAFDFLTKPLDYGQLEKTLDAAGRKIGRHQSARSLERQLEEDGGFRDFVGTSKKMREVYDVLRLLSDNQASALLTGESGTGKELAARTIHECGPRATEPFVAVNMAALPETLIERELFGHVRGAFTGAAKTQGGLFESANGGTIFLDEIAEMPLSLQPTLLRVLEESAVRKIGSSKTVPVDVRILAATNQDPETAIREQKLRQDLYFRLGVFNVELPPLRERREDLPLLAHAFVRQFNRKHDTKVEGVEGATLQRFQAYHWPGNVRELSNFMERAVILAKTGWIEPHHLPAFLRDSPNGGAAEHIAVPSNSTVAEAEKILILETLKRLDNNRSRTAKALGVTVRTIRNKLRQYREAGELDEGS